MTISDTRKRPTIQEIARISGLSTATIDRVLNNRPGVKESTRKMVEEAIAQAFPDRDAATAVKNVAFVLEAGSSFIALVSAALDRIRAEYPEVQFTFDSVPNYQRDLQAFSQLLKRRIADADAVILVSREELTINSEVREGTARGVPIICLTSDLPHSTACVGADEISVGANAALFMGRMLNPAASKVLFIASATYRTQEEREMGFRRVMRNEFPHLHIIEKMSSNDESEGTYQIMQECLQLHPDIGGVYNLAGGNRGIARALREANLANKVTFIGHELTEHTQKLLVQGEMDIVFSHDLDAEIRYCLQILAKLSRNEKLERVYMPSLVYTKYSRF